MQPGARSTEPGGNRPPTSHVGGGGSYPPHQAALIDQAAKRLGECHNSERSLVHDAGNENLGLVPESLAYAALLLAGTRTATVDPSNAARAGQLIDAVLQTQYKLVTNPNHGSFPTACSLQPGSRPIEDPHTHDLAREIVSSILAVLLLDYAPALGPQRANEVDHAIRNALRPGKDMARLPRAIKMLAAWLHLEHGNALLSGRLIGEIETHDQASLCRERFGDPRAIALELWALSLWYRSNRLKNKAKLLLPQLFATTAHHVHPQLPEMFGVATTTKGNVGSYPWLGAWLTWHAVGYTPLLPRSLGDPVLASCFAFPALVAAAPDWEVPEPFPVERTGRALEQQIADQAMTGWWEPNLHIEARDGGARCDSTAPVVGICWLARDDQVARLLCHTSNDQRATCNSRFVHLENPGTTVLKASNIGGEARMADNTWILSGLCIAWEGFQLIDAQRNGLDLQCRLRPTSDKPTLMIMATDGSADAARGDHLH